MRSDGIVQMHKMVRTLQLFGGRKKMRSLIHWLPLNSEHFLINLISYFLVRYSIRMYIFIWKNSNNIEWQRKSFSNNIINNNSTESGFDIIP